MNRKRLENLMLAAICVLLALAASSGIWHMFSFHPDLMGWPR